MKLKDRLVMAIDKEPVSGIADFAIPYDPATYEEEAPARQLSLFNESHGDDDD
jgi:hypothetical protein